MHLSQIGLTISPEQMIDIAHLLPLSYPSVQKFTINYNLIIIHILYTSDYCIKKSKTNVYLKLVT